ncbi:HAMP domain-containing histidine kinase [Bacillus vallismortis]|uniref:HAMP domain-containing histidine kinase n=1 Tax=Bacillus vallismortis TaxID=72361 RepID=UPI00227FACBD|nr:HAMP domain-containing histidine kinase [Bacillus vallismortis]MCY8307628.1 HAMP domain-containing histidine kinase [Bacillus vallismortis]MCY8595569.1 HAMP domain-containing histidine kinase [Bacillus vallismortis]
MGIGVKSRKTLLRELVKYLVTLCVSLVVLALLYIFVNTIAMNTGFSHPANYNEREAEKLAPKLETIDEVTADMIPDTMSYAILNKETKQKTAGTIQEKDLQLVKKKIEKKPYVNYKQKGYMVIDRGNEYCVLQYSLRADFGSPLLRKYLPNYELTSICILIILLIIVISIITTYFANRLRKHFETLNVITRYIKEQNLQFTPEFTHIKEFDDVIDSLIEMRDALQSSLEAQWRLEKNKKEQIGALAHDIKIPITIIKGNAELLSLSKQNEEQADYTKYILGAGNQIEQYIYQLIHLSKTEDSLTVHFEKASVEKLTETLQKDISAYKGNKKINIVFKKEHLLKEAQIDRQLLHRALLNILTNAVDYTPEGGTVSVYAKCDSESFYFFVRDTGSGFSEIALKKATELFYMDDKSRHAKGHYGMGLTFAKNAVNLHNGELALGNTKAGGGEVRVKIPLNKE